MLSQLSTLGSNAFYGTQITSIDLTRSSISGLPNGVFRNCSSLSKISIPTSVTYLDEHWGDGLPATLTLEGFDNISSHAQYNYSVSNKTILNPIKTSLVSEKTLISITNNNDSSYINSLYEPLRTSTFAGYRMSNYIKTTQFCYTSGGNNRMNIELLYFRDITQFGSRTFWKCDINNLVIDNVSPPTLNVSQNETDSIWGNEIFPTGNSDVNDNVTIGTLWVPDSAVATYQANPLYSHLIIKGINTKTNGVDYDLPRYVDYAAWKTAEEAAVAQGGHAPVGLIEAWM